MTLTEISYYSRRMAPFAILLFLIVLVFYYAIRLLFVFVDLNRPPAVALDTTFGKIHAPRFVESTPSSGIEYRLDTIEGEPVTATESARIIFIPPPATTFGYREKMYIFAKASGFDTDKVKHNFVGKEAVFEDANQKLTIDVSNFNFTYENFFQKQEDLFATITTPEKNQSENAAINFLQSIGRYPKELTQGTINFSYLLYNPATSSLSPVENIVKANIVELDFYGPDVDGFPLVSSKYFNRSNYIFLAFDSSKAHILRAQIRFFERSDTQTGIYPVKSGSTAFGDLKKGKGYIVSNPDKATTVVIKKMFVAYYDPELYEEYLQPVYVFLGENNFVAYVPAITDEYLAN